ncbi:MAG: enoyl-CoA hydratase/isomerase family protein [Proteobacteria bacterium]|nr:enoyl-CoA hydratase/isomerase family protein [Pseudomonadota bacterium]
MIELHTHGSIHEIRLARPPVNALVPELLQALRAAVEDAPGKGARGIVLAGGQGVFSGGMDVPHLMGVDVVGLRRAWDDFFAACHALAKSPVPVVAAVGGHAPAGGCVLALCCDYRVMARAPDPAKPFRIGLNEVQVGLAVPEGVQRLLRRLVGPRRAERLMVAGALVPARRAFAIGMVDELADLPEVTPRAIGWLNELLALPSSPMLRTRALARADVIDALENHVHLERFLDAWNEPDTQETLKSLVAKLKK